MRRFFIQVREEVFEKVARQALAERRDVRDQAAIILERLVNQDVTSDEYRQEVA